MDKVGFFLQSWIGGFVSGFVVGWILLKRPQWTSKAFAWIRGQFMK